jgi:hypothetical protein
LEPHDGIRSNLRETKGVDDIIAFGSWSIYKSYLLAGFDPNKIFPIGWKYWDPLRNLGRSDLINYSLDKGPRRVILAYLGSICVRKGVMKMEPIANYLTKNFPEFQLKLVGFVNNAHLRRHLEELNNKYGKNFTWVDTRVDYASRSWAELKSDTAFAIFPSTEEGLSGCAMDSINLGIPLFHSDKTGLDFVSQYQLDLDFESTNFLDNLGKVIEGGPRLWDELAKLQQQTAFFQNQDNNSIHKTLVRQRAGNIWPKIRLNEASFSRAEIESLQKSDLNNCLDQGNFEYEIIKAEDSSHIKPNLNLRYFSDKSSSLSLNEAIRLAVMTLDKYQNAHSILLQNASQDRLLAKSRQSGQQVLRADLLIREYRTHLPTEKRSLRTVLWMESLADFRFTFLTYLPKRLANIIRIKMKIEFLKLLRASKLF